MNTLRTIWAALAVGIAGAAALVLLNSGSAPTAEGPTPRSAPTASQPPPVALTLDRAPADGSLRVHGQVSRTGDLPAAGADVSLFALHPRTAPRPLADVRTNADGSFSFQIWTQPEQLLELAIELPGHAPWTLRRRRSDFESTWPIGRVRLGHGMRVIGRVVGRNAQGIAGATLDLRFDGRGAPRAAADEGAQPPVWARGPYTTRPDGSFDLHHLPQQRLSLEVQAPGYGAVRTRPQNPPSQGSTMRIPDIVMERSMPCTGTIVDSHNDPVPGAMIRAIFERDGERHAREALSGPDGTFAVQTPPGEHEFVAQHPDFATTRRRLVAAANVRIQLLDRHTIRVAVVDSVRDTPVTRFGCVAHRAEGPDAAAGPADVHLEQQHHPEGSVELLVHSDTAHFVTIDADGYCAERFGPLNTNRNETAVLALTPGARGRVIVRDRDGRAIRNASVRFVPETGIPSRVQTNREGTATAFPIWPGMCDVMVDAPGFAPFETNLEIRGTGNTYPVTLTRGATVSGSLPWLPIEARAELFFRATATGRAVMARVGPGSREFRIPHLPPGRTALEATVYDAGFRYRIASFQASDPVVLELRDGDELQIQVRDPAATLGSVLVSWPTAPSGHPLHLRSTDGKELHPIVAGLLRAHCRPGGTALFEGVPAGSYSIVTTEQGQPTVIRDGIQVLPSRQTSVILRDQR